MDESWRLREGARAFDVKPSDRLTITDLEGGQPAWLTATRPDGRSGLATLGLDGNREPDGAALFSTEAGAGQSLSLEISEALLCRLVVPQSPSTLEDLRPATEIEVRIARDAAVTPEPPPPLGPPRLDIRIDRATAQAYRVKAGDYIQVIDIAGRQCSDFVAFDAGLLDQGIECGLDATATRTLTGKAYPTPGLYGKFFDGRMRPMLELVRDTCGRHDSFAYACTAKYYDDAGYPGHASCSENFNQALAPFKVAARPGWQAINFFYNTILDASGTVGLDEPWSRPGDYVLMRALTDLVCDSSACPDDIDPANGWEPTDIQVRIYPADQSFSPAIAYRMTADSPPILTRETGFHARIAPLSRRMIEYRNFWLPADFAGQGAIAEYWAARTRVAVMDLSPLRKFEVTGPDAEALLDYAVTRDIAKLSVGQIVYTAMCYPHGGMVDDATVFRLGRDQFRIVFGDEYGGTWLRDLAAERGFKAWVRSSTPELHNIAVQGPSSRDLLSKIVWTPPTRPNVAELGWFRFTIGRIGDALGLPVVLSRTGYTGELGYELWCHPAHAPDIWDAVWLAGQPLGLAPLGLEALDMLRIEAGLAFGGYEFSDQTDPFEAGIGFTVPLKSKERDFVGRAALERRKAQPQRKLVGLDIDSNESVGHGDCLHIGRAQIGIVTSGVRSPALGKTIALARVDVAYAELGTALEVGKLDGQQKRLKAQIVRFPHYDPDKTRVRV